MRVTALYIIAAVAGILALILWARIKVAVRYLDSAGDDEKLTLTVGYGLFRLRLIPKKKRRVKLRDFSYKKTHKEKAEKKKPKKAKKQAPKKKKKQTEPAVAEEAPKGSAAMMLWEMREIILDLLKRAPGKLRLNINTLALSVGGEDAASTAITYGAITQAVGSALTLAKCRADVRIKRDAVLIEPDFLSGRLRADVDVCLSVRVGSVLGLAIRFVWKFIMLKISSTGEKTMKAKG